MPKLWIIAWHEFFTNVRRPGYIFVTLMPPILGVIGIIIIAFFAGQTGDLVRSQFSTESKPVGIVDQSGLYPAIPSQFARRFTLFSDENAARSALLAGQLGGYVVIPRDYVQTGKLVTYVRNTGGFSSATQFPSSDLARLLVYGMLSGKVDTTTQARVGDPTGKGDFITLDSKGNPTTDNPLSGVSGFIAPYFLSVFLIISIFASSNYLLRSVSEEKETRVMEIIVSSVSSTDLLAGKVIGLGVLGLLQMSVWLLTAFVLSGGLGAVIAGLVITLNPSLFVLAVVYFVFGYLIYAIIMATAGSLGTTQRESQQLAGIFSFAAAVPYMLSGLIFTNPNAGILRVLSYFPFTASTMMLLRLPLGGVPQEDIIGSIVVLAVSVPIVLWAGAKIFRMGLLMYGKRPALGQIVRALREA